MASLDTSLNDADFIDEVRDALAGLGTSKIPDNTIIQARERVVEPALNNIGDYQDPEDQDAFDNASIMWTAEKAFDAWLVFTRLRDREVEAYTNPSQYKAQLESRTNLILDILGVSRPPDLPNQVVSITHDGVKRAVDLSQEWVEVDDTNEGVY
jgi:hypothetical protein